MTDQPGVTVILPTFNRAGFIAEAIQSVLTQTQAPRDFIVVDDGSTDGTDEVVARFGGNVSYVRQENAGKLTAIATGLDRTAGELVWIMDDDDIAAPDAIEQMAAPFARDDGVVLSYGRMTKFDDADPARGEVPVVYPEDDRPFLVQLMEDCFVTGHPCVMVRRTALQALRPFDPAVIASVDYYLHLGVAAQGPVARVDSVVLRQRQHGGLRGPAEQRYAEADRNARWVAHDAYLLAPMIRDLPEEAWVDPPPWTGRPLTAGEQRRAMVQKAVVAGRKKLWPQATEALEGAMAMLPGVPLDAEELRILGGMLGSRYGIDEVHDAPDIVLALRRACGQREDRTVALTALSRPLLHEIKIARRERDPRRAGRAVRTWARLMDLRSTQVALRSAIGRNLTRAAARMRPT
jgi:hypothetical protein